MLETRASGLNLQLKMDFHRPLVVPDFLDPTTIAYILDELEYCFWSPSQVIKEVAGNYLSGESHHRRSETAHMALFTDELLSIISDLAKRVARLAGESVDKFEEWQITRYRKGDAFDYHHDCGASTASPIGDRDYTVLIHLQEPLKGGETFFPEIGCLVPAKAGSLVLWKNLHNHGPRNMRMLHAGLSIKAGTKTSLVTWIRKSSARL